MTEFIQLAEDGPASRRIRGVTYSRGDPREVDDELAEFLLELDDFETVEEEDDEVDADETPDEDSPDAITTGDVVPEPDDEADGFDADAWLDQDYTEREDAVLAGDVDAHLDEIADVETSETVENAVEERRAELEG